MFLDPHVRWNGFFNVTINDISVIYVMAHSGAGGLKEASHHTVFTYRSKFDLLDALLAFLISIMKIYKSLQNTGLQISQASENIWKVL